MKLFKRKPKYFIIPVSIARQDGLDQTVDLKWRPGEAIWIRASQDDRPTRVLKKRENIILDIGTAPKEGSALSTLARQAFQESDGWRR